MSATICICCCEPLTETGKTLSRNPNVCASCLSMVDGMDDITSPDEVSPETEAREARKHVEHDVTGEGLPDDVVAGYQTVPKSR